MVSKSEDVKEKKTVRTSRTVRSVGLFWLGAYQSPSLSSRWKINEQDGRESLLQGIEQLPRGQTIGWARINIGHRTSWLGGSAIVQSGTGNCRARVQRLPGNDLCKNFPGSHIDEP